MTRRRLSAADRVTLVRAYETRTAIHYAAAGNLIASGDAVDCGYVEDRDSAIRVCQLTPKGENRARSIVRARQERLARFLAKKETAK